MIRRFARLACFAGPLMIIAGLAGYHARFVANPPYPWLGTARAGWSAGLIGLLWVTSYAAGLPGFRSTRRGAVFASVVSVAAAMIAVSLAQLLIGSALLPRFVMFGGALVLMPWYVLCARMGSDDRQRRVGVVVVGDVADVGSLLVDIDGDVEQPATLVAMLTPSEAAGGRGRSPLLDAAGRSDVSVVVLDNAAQADRSVVRQAAALHERGVRIRTLSAFYEEWFAKLPIGELERVSLMFDIAEIHQGGYAPVKRVMDVLIGLVMAVVALLIAPVVVIGNRFANRGPLLYRQARVGKGGVEFTMLKFRTMTPSTGPSDWTAPSDPRVTAFGRWMRRTHVDELPQAWNILRGELSVVGPRPEQPKYVAELTDKLPFYGLRHLVRPGLTGWAQVKYGYAGDHQDALEKLQYEFFYLRRQSLKLDLRILVRTLRSVMGGAGAGR